MSRSDLQNGPAVIDSRAGRKQAIHFGAAGRPLSGFYHPPRAATWKGVGVVLCAPIGTDQTRSDRAYRHLAERLAAAGFACLRFDPYGTGDSGGDEQSTDLVKAWVDDIGIAAQELRARSSAGPISIVGLRIGATLAAVAAARRGDIDALVLWSPCVSGAAFVREVTKLHKLYMRIEPQLAGTQPPAGEGQEALGCFWPREVLQELAALDLMDLPKPPAARVLVLDGGQVPASDALVGRLVALGTATEVRRHGGDRFLLTISHRALLPEDALEAITSWLDDAFPGTALSGSGEGERGLGLEREREREREWGRAASFPGGAAPCGERHVVFGAHRPLFGILTPADASRRVPGRPPILVTNAGCVNRSGPHRITVRMARQWAYLGYDVLRVDLSGIGDSPAAPDAPENITHPPGGQDDLDQAIRALGSDQVVLAGLCSGGDFAFQLGWHDRRVVGAWMLNPRTFGVLDLAAVEAGDGSRPASYGAVSEVPRGLRSMAEAGVDALLVVSIADPGTAYVDAHAGDEMRALAGVAGFERIDIQGADHTFTPVTTQRRVSDVLTRHLESRF